MKVAIVTATRAEYGILYPLIKKLSTDDLIDLQLLVTGTHLSEKYGNTQNEILNDGFTIFKRYPILTNGNSTLDTSLVMANALISFAKYFEEEKPTCVIILGDRTEMLGISAAAVDSNIPIVHLHGGEITEGAIDDCIRHAITKLAYLHFPSTEEYRKRIIQMGESPDRVFNVGALGVENILKIEYIEKQKLFFELNIPIDKKLVVVTFHPVTLENGQERQQTEELIKAMELRNSYFYLITKANSDAGGDVINNMFEQYVNSNKNSKLVSSLGMKKYLSVMKYSEFILGNSSSGVIEAPSIGTPTVNIGNRQKGRMMAKSIINCEPICEDILNAIDLASKCEHVASYIYGNGNTSDKIIKIIKNTFNKNNFDVQKEFYDIKFGE